MCIQRRKDIKGNEAADKLRKQESNIRHESEGIVTPAGLKTCSNRIIEEARRGNGNGLGPGEERPYQHTPSASRTRDHIMGGCSE